MLQNFKNKKDKNCFRRKIKILIIVNILPQEKLKERKFYSSKI